MKNKVLKSIVAVLLTVVMLAGTNPINTFASTNDDVQYVENHEQIDFTNLDISVVNKNDVIVNVSDDISVFDKFSAKKEKEKYEEFISKDPDNSELFLNSVNDGECLVAFSYTEAPLEFVDDHFERIKKEKPSQPLFAVNANAIETTSNGHEKYNFTLATKIVRYGSSSPYTYTAYTSGMWSDNSAIGGSEYPASGNDFVLQSCPYTTNSDTFVCTYNNNVGLTQSIYGRSGEEYWAENGGDCYIRYGVEDDPLGNEQLVSFTMSQKFSTSEITKTKKINSYYVHTWRQMTIGVAVQGSTNGSVASVGLEITPSIVDKQWQVYDYVTCTW